VSSADSVRSVIDNIAPRPAILRPLERFLHIEAASGVVLLAAAIVALIWANSPAADLYEALWHTSVGVQIGEFVFSQSLHFVINDMLMTVFFLVVGLEIRREMYDGALADLRLASLPIIAAMGGVVAPALIYISLNTTPELRNGWAVPTATDIAFAVGVLALLGKRVPASLRVLLLALAIIDDIIAILIIALFYSSGLHVAGLAIVAAGVVLVFVFQRLGFRSAWAYVVPGAIVWFGVLDAQIHPTIAGVILGLITPVRRLARHEQLADVANDVVAMFRLTVGRDADSQAPVKYLANVQREMLAPAERVQLALHPWVAFGIMPLFALANSGVSLGSLSLGSLFHEPVSLGVILGLCLGKPLGITLASVLAIRFGLARLPDNAELRGVLLVGCLGGIGFTMAIFIANLAFTSAELLAEAKLAILLASAISGVAGLALGRVLLPRRVA
jgi:Na+:H+ antiporter, NhaA family